MKLIGNEANWKVLLRIANQFPSSLLFAGPEGVGKSLFAEAFAKLILGEVPHPDLYIFRPEGKTAQHSIESVRRLTEEVYRTPYVATHKVFIIHEADRMMVTSSNALLKTFEEPLPTSLIILLTSKKERILPTILSRCQTLYFHAIEEQKIEAFLKEQGVSEEEAARCAHGSRGSMAEALKLLKKDPVRDYLVQVLATESFSHYPTLIEVSKELAALIEAKAPEESPIEGVLTAAQREAHQKEFEGFSRLSLAEEFYALLDEIYYWYRDKLLLSSGGDPKFLFHKESTSFDSPQTCDTRFLKKLEKEIVAAKLAFDRSTSLQICFEKLFLSLC